MTTADENDLDEMITLFSEPDDIGDLVDSSYDDDDLNPEDDDSFHPDIDG